MNQVQVNTNVKGQLVIPIAMRKYWEITDQTPLNVTNVPNVGIIIKPSPKTSPLTDEEFMDILEATKGTMVAADWDETEKKLDRLAKQELKEMKANAW
jgi:bifunctional DNA-binding transcriptional regulator/antitoxin component of YhaV-PrlF toxin-antitoxin module